MEERLLNVHNKKVLAGFCIYKALLDFIYIKCQNCFAGIVLFGLDFSFDKYLISWLLFLLFTFFYNFFLFDKDRLRQSFSQQVFLLLFLLSVVPFFSMYGGGAISDECSFYFNVYLYVLLIAQTAIDYYRNDSADIEASIFDLDKLNKWKKGCFFIMCAATIATITIIFFYYVGGVFFTDGLQVYEQREAFNQISKNMPRVLIYMLGFANVVEILMFLYCLQKKKYMCTCLLLILFYMHFSIAAEKSVLFSVVLAIAIYFVSAKITILKVVVFHIIISLACLLLAFCSYVYYITDWEQSDFLDLLCWFGSVTPSDLFRRVFFVPAYLQNVWFGYFADRMPNYWGLNTDYSVGQGIDNYIMDLYQDSPLGFANTGLLGDCFANMGEYGVFVYPIVIVIILCCFDYVLRGKNVIIFMGLSLLLVLNISNSMLTTAMLSHGGLIMLIMLWCFPEEDKKCCENQI